MFLINCKGSNKADLVPTKEANIKIPQMVLKFYVNRLTWYTVGMELKVTALIFMKQ